MTDARWSWFLQQANGGNGMFIAEAMEDVRTNILVLVPWRILVRQTSLEWLENTSWDPDEFEFRYGIQE